MATRPARCSCCKRIAFAADPRSDPTSIKVSEDIFKARIEALARVAKESRENAWSKIISG